MANKVVNLIIKLTGASKINAAFGKMGAGLGRLGGAFKKMAKLGGTAIAGIGTAFVGAVVEGAKFNVEMARVWTMAGKGIASFRNLRKEARELASDFGIARSEVAQGMYNALSAGIKETDLSGVMKTAAKVAVADGTTISIAIDGMTTVMNAFKIEAANSESVADDLFKTVALGKTTFGELAKSLSAVAPIASASNIPLKQILAHVAALTAQGVPTAQAMTQIRASIIGLNKALGDGWSSTKSYQDALKAVWKQSGQSQTRLLELVGSTEAVSAVLGGVGINAGMAAQKLNAMGSSAGAAQAAFDKVDQFRHWPKLLETARGALSKFGEIINEKIHPSVLKVTDLLKKWRDSGAIEKWAEQAKAGLQAVVDTIKIIKGGGDAKDEVLGKIGAVIIAAFTDAGSVVVAIIKNAAPAIGNLIASGMKGAVSSMGQGSADRAVAEKRIGDAGGFERSLPFTSAAKRNEAKIQAEIEKIVRDRVATLDDSLVESIGKAGGRTKIAMAKLKAVFDKYKIETPEAIKETSEKIAKSLSTELPEKIGEKTVEKIKQTPETEKTAEDIADALTESLTGSSDTGGAPNQIAEATVENNPIAEAIKESNANFGITNDTPVQGISGGGGGINSLTGVNDIFGSLTTRGIEGGGGLTTTKALEAIKDLLGTNPEDMSEAMKTALADVYSDSWKTTDLTLYEKISKHVSTITTMFSTAFGNATKAISDCALKITTAIGSSEGALSISIQNASAKIIAAISSKTLSSPTTMATIDAPEIKQLTVEPLTVEPLTVEPLTVEPLTVEPLTVEPLTVEPLTVEPLTVIVETKQPELTEQNTDDVSLIDPETITALEDSLTGVGESFVDSLNNSLAENPIAEATVENNPIAEATKAGNKAVIRRDLKEGGLLETESTKGTLWMSKEDRRAENLLRLRNDALVNDAYASSQLSKAKEREAEVTAALGIGTNRTSTALANYQKTLSESAKSNAVLVASTNAASGAVSSKEGSISAAISGDVSVDSLSNGLADAVKKGIIESDSSTTTAGTKAIQSSGIGSYIKDAMSVQPESQTITDYLSSTIQGFSIKPEDMISGNEGSKETNTLLTEQNKILNERLGGVESR